MKTVLVTGAAGVLGSALMPRLIEAGYRVRATSRREVIHPDVEWVPADLETGDGLTEATDGVDLVIHSASSPFRKGQETDVRGTDLLLAASYKAGVEEFLYISIVGIDRIPFGYYKNKLAAERFVEAISLKWSILRATQFHTLVDTALSALSKLPIMPLAVDFQFQLIDPGDVAQHVVAGVKAGQTGRWADIGGPQVLRMGDLARLWLAARGMRRIIVPLYVPGRVAYGFRQGYNCVPAGASGTITWQDWLNQHYVSPTKPLAEVSA